jgi:ribonuclease E
MDHDTDVATPQAPAADRARDTAADERAAAFKRGAPTPRPAKPAAAPEPQLEPKPDPRPEPRPKPAPRTRAKAEPVAEATDVAPAKTRAPRAPRPAADEDSASPAPRKPAARRAPTRKPPGSQIASDDVTTDRSAASTPSDEAASSPKPRQPRQRTPKPVATQARVSDVATDGEADRTDAEEVPARTSEDQTGPGAPRKRRRRGGRGRGRGSSSGASRPDRDTGTADDEPIMGDTPDTQRDDALPDTTSSHGSDSAEPGASTSRRRRGSRGSGVTRRPTDGDPPGKGDPQRSGAKEPGSGTKSGDGKARSSRSKAKPMTVEEQVAAGGRTRGIRNTRSRTGRSGGGGGGGDRRRRRDPIVLPPRITDKLMVITEHGDRDQIAVLEEDALVQHYVTRTGATSMVGNVYLGRVQNVLPGMEAAFVDIGRGRNGVLYAGEVNYRPEDLEGPAPRIEQVLKSGQAVMVQVTKDPMGGKGARLTAQISLPGRYLVFAPEQSLSGISRRLPDEERKRLKSIMRKIKPDGDGVIVRTAAEGAPEENLTHDLERLVRVWEEIGRRAKKVKAPEVLYEEPELTVRVFRDLFTDEEYRELVTDSPRVYDKIMGYVKDVAPDLEPKVRLHQGKLSAFEEHRIVEQIHKALDRKVWLPSGGYLIIERTEAMTIVDVNTGKSVGKTNLEETVVNTNLEAAAEVARQLRLRDIGGIIVVDFIDMLLEKNKKQVEDIMRDALAIDKTRSQVFEIGPLGLLQVTRKRVSGGLVESFSETCPTCEGRGILLNYEA